MWLVGHICFGLLFIEMLLRKLKVQLNKTLIAFAIIFSLLPDIDLLFDIPSLIAFTPAYHGGITHTIFFLVGFVSIVFVCSTILVNEQRLAYTLTCFVGLSIHLIADVFVGAGGIALLYPLSNIQTNLGIYSYIDRLNPRPPIDFYQFFIIFDAATFCIYFFYKLYTKYSS